MKADEGLAWLTVLKSATTTKRRRIERSRFNDPSLGSHLAARCWLWIRCYQRVMGEQINLGRDVQCISMYLSEDTSNAGSRTLIN